jgi:5-methylcytosine-specific restriction endonuclease McrA
MRKQVVCRVKDCEKLGASKGIRNGAPDYRSLCEHHRRPGRLSVDTKYKDDKDIISRDKCTKCGWLGRCHRHRINGSMTEYIPSNILVLCPNCHQEEHEV